MSHKRAKHMPSKNMKGARKVSYINFDTNIKYGAWQRTLVINIQVVN